MNGVVKELNIDKTSGPSFIQSYQNQMKVAKVAKAKPVQKEDNLQISTEAKEMFEKNVEMERQQKINMLKAQIESGEYQTNSEKVADKIYQYWFGK